MALELCPSCYKNISVDATTCPKCGQPLPEGWAAVQKKKIRKYGFFGFLAIFLVLLGITYGPKLFDSESDSCGTRVRALFEAKEFVTARLKSPGSASFASSLEAKVAMKSCGRWIISSYVDASNSLGAKIRTRFLTTVERQDDGTWRLVDLTLIGQ